MKFTSSSLSLVLFLSAVSTVSSFAPNTVHTTRIGTSATSFNDHIITADTRTSTELGLFGSRWRQARKFNAPAKTIGKGSSITEEEVRSLFTLWNSALATGDSRIVASRYTKVSLSFLLAMFSYDVCLSHTSVSSLFIYCTTKRTPCFCLQSRIRQELTTIPSRITSMPSFSRSLRERSSKERSTLEIVS
jgi:hypothetical protein